jgi:hypothetical protein
VRKHFSLFIVLAFIMLVVVGCSTPKINTADKAVAIDGYFTLNQVTPYDPLTKTVCSIRSLIASGVYFGIPADAQSKDFAYYCEKESYSIWNAEARTAQLTLIICTNSREHMQKYIGALAKRIKPIKKPEKKVPAAATLKADKNTLKDLTINALRDKGFVKKVRVKVCFTSPEETTADANIKV